MPNLNSPTHETIAQRAREIWNHRGNPAGHDTLIWLEAERQLTPVSVEAMRHDSPAAQPSAGPFVHQHAEPSGLGQILAEPSPAHLHPAIAPAPDPDVIAASTARQKKSARAPRLPKVLNAPKSAPPESGKPLWDKPHSS